MNNFYYILLCKIVYIYIWGGKNQILVFSVYTWYTLFEWLLVLESYCIKLLFLTLEYIYIYIYI